MRLYRTGLPFLVRPSFPSETGRYLICKRLFGEMKGRPVITRTLDAVGGKWTERFGMQGAASTASRIPR